MNAITALDICNLALSKLGVSPILEIDANGSPAARQCYMHYHPVRREVLCAHRWSFAQKMLNLHKDMDDVSESGAMLIQHNLPFDCLRVLNVNQDCWTLRGRAVFSYSNDVKILYIYDCDESEYFDPLFIEAFAMRMACKMCIALISSRTTYKSLLEEYSRVSLPNAAHFNAVQSHSNDTHPLYKLWSSYRKHSSSDFDDC